MTSTRILKLLCFNLLVALVFSGVFLSKHNQFVHAQEKNEIDALQDMLEWNQKYLEAYTELTSIYSADAMTRLYSTDFNDFDAVKSAYSHFDAERNAILSRSSRMFNDLEPPTRWNINKSILDRDEKIIFNSAKEQFDQIPLIIKSVEEASDLLPFIELLQEEEFETAMSMLVEKQFSGAEMLIKTENKQIDNVLPVIPKTHPNHQIQLIFKMTNEFSITELEWSRLEIEESQSLQSRKKFTEKMQGTIKRVPALITLSRKNSEKFLVQMNKAINTGGGSKQEIAMLNGAIKAFNTYETSLDIEEKLYANQLKTVTLMQSDLLSDDFEVKSDLIALEYFELIDRRVSLATERLSLMQQ